MGSPWTSAGSPWEVRGKSVGSPWGVRGKSPKSPCSKTARKSGNLPKSPISGPETERMFQSDSRTADFGLEAPSFAENVPHKQSPTPKRISVLKTFQNQKVAPETPSLTTKMSKRSFLLWCALLHDLSRHPQHQPSKTSRKTAEVKNKSHNFKLNPTFTSNPTHHLL